MLLVVSFFFSSRRRHTSGALVTGVQTWSLPISLAKYRDQPFKWGRYDCARVIAHQAKKLGHKVSLAKAGSYSSALGAKRALAKVGYATLSEALDAHLPRIAPASALLGDIIEIE